MHMDDRRQLLKYDGHASDRGRQLFHGVANFFPKLWVQLLFLLGKGSAMLFCEATNDKRKYFPLSLDSASAKETGVNEHRVIGLWAAPLQLPGSLPGALLPAT